MGVGVKALSEELLLYAGVPKVLDLIVGPTGQVLGYLRPPVAKNSVHVDDGPLFLGREGTPFQVRPQVVYPPQPATLSTSLESGELRYRAPAADAESGDVVEELLVFLGRPQPFSQLLLHTARMSPHFFGGTESQRSWREEDNRKDNDIS